MKQARAALSSERIGAYICSARGHRVMLDADLAALYGVPTRVLVQAVKRNVARFPADFMFRLTWDEVDSLGSQFVILKNPPLGRGKHRKYPPHAFTEHGVAMLSSVLKSRRAVNVSIEIVRAFIRLRHALAMNIELARRLDDLEKRVGDHDEQFVAVIRTIRELMEPPPTPKKRRIGFHPAPEESAT